MPPKKKPLALCAIEGCHGRVKRRGRKYCSADCQHKSLRILKDKECPWCHKLFRPKERRQKTCGDKGCVSKQASYVHQKRKLGGQDEGFEVSYSGQSGSLTYVGPNITDPDALLSHCNVDTDVWGIKKLVVGSHQGPMKLREFIKDGAKGRYEDKGFITTFVKINATLEMKVAEIAMRKAADRILSRFCEKAPPAKFFPTHSSSRVKGLLTEVIIPDLQLGQVNNPEAHGGLAYDSEIAVELYRRAFSDVIEKALRFGTPEKLLVGFGNDIANIDNVAKTTTSGTQVGSDLEWEEIFDTVVYLLHWSIEQAMRVAPIDCLMVRGNHDWHTVYSAGCVAQERFRHAKHVSINNSKDKFKFYRWGRTLLGLCHGRWASPAKLPARMAQDWRIRDEWAKARFGRWQVGDKHHHKITVQDHEQIEVEIFPTLAPASDWAYKQGLSANRSALALGFDKDDGPVFRTEYNVT